MSTLKCAAINEFVNWLKTNCAHFVCLCWWEFVLVCPSCCPAFKVSLPSLWFPGQHQISSLLVVSSFSLNPLNSSFPLCLPPSLVYRVTPASPRRSDSQVSSARTSAAGLLLLHTRIFHFHFLWGQLLSSFFVSARKTTMEDTTQKHNRALFCDGRSLWRSDANFDNFLLWFLLLSVAYKRPPLWIK